MLRTNAVQEYAITEALRIAAETYSSDAHEADMCNHPRTAEQFRNQAQHARTLKALIENGDLTHACSNHRKG